MHGVIVLWTSSLVLYLDLVYTYVVLRIIILCSGFVVERSLRALPPLYIHDVRVKRKDLAS